MVFRCVNRNFCNGKGKVTRSRNNRLTFKNDRRGFLVRLFLNELRRFFWGAFLRDFFWGAFWWDYFWMNWGDFFEAFKLFFFKTRLAWENEKALWAFAVSPQNLPGKDTVEDYLDDIGDLDGVYDLTDMNDLINLELIKTGKSNNQLQWMWMEFQGQHLVLQLSPKKWDLRYFDWPPSVQKISQKMGILVRDHHWPRLVQKCRT